MILAFVGSNPATPAKRGEIRKRYKNGSSVKIEISRTRNRKSKFIRLKKLTTGRRTFV